MSSDTKYQHPSIGSSNNFSTQITMLARCSPKARRGSSSCHDNLSSIWVRRAAATSVKRCAKHSEGTKKTQEAKNKKKNRHSVHLHRHCWRMTWSRLYSPRRLSLTRSSRTIALSWFRARVQVDPPATPAHAVDTYPVAWTSGDVRCRGLTGLGEPSKCEKSRKVVQLHPD